MADEVARAWDAEYAAGRYTREPPVSFVTDIVAAAGFAPVLALRPHATWRTVRQQGLWLQWEGIYRDAA